MAISKLPLGMNARNFNYIRKFNHRSDKIVADDKVLSKRLFVKHGIPTTKIFNVFKDRKSVSRITWNFPQEGFVLKPVRGYGGEGILIFKNWHKLLGGETILDEYYDRTRLKSHIYDILEGAYSLQYLPDKAYIEERVIPKQFFPDFEFSGLPDIRIIVFNKVPIMAMMRLPTDESGGKANLHQGALGIGVSIRSGITTGGIYKNEQIDKIPGTNTSIVGIKIPFWEKILQIACRAQEVSGLGFAGIDVVIDDEKGPMVLELNTRPGLNIQLANNASLRTRMERLENIYVPTITRGVELGRSLFASDEFEAEFSSPLVLSVIENVTFMKGKKPITVKAKLDTGAFRSALDMSLAKELGYSYLKKKFLVKSASGTGYRPAVRISFKLLDRKINTTATVVDRAHLKYPLIIGRKDLKGILVNPTLPEDREDYAEEYSKLY